MPTYEYCCDECGRTYEVRQRISAPALTHCQYCNGPIRRLLSPAPFILKGGGWYVTDYPSASRKKAMEAEKKTAAPAKSATGANSGEGGASPPSKTESTAPPPSAGGSTTPTP